MILPYWNTDLDLEIAPWFPLGLDYHPVSFHRFDSPLVSRIASHCLAFDSEFLFLSSLRIGCVGSLIRDGFFRDDPAVPPLLGFIMILAYSPEIERLVVDTLTEPLPDFQAQEQAHEGECDSGAPEAPEVPYSGLVAGVALCSLWTQMRSQNRQDGFEADAGYWDYAQASTSSGTGSGSGSGQDIPEPQEYPVRSGGHVLLGSMKVIALVSENPFFDETDFLSEFEARLTFELAMKNSRASRPFFAEKFGYRRFSMPYYTDDPTQRRISQILHEMEFAETRQVVGPAPEVPFPPLMVMR